MASQVTERTEPFQVLALGLSRSGTESLCKALDILGYNCYHGWRTLENHDQCVNWTEAMEAKFENKGKVWQGAKDFDKILGQYTACADLPCAMFATELMEAYPDAKVILNQRPVDDWYRSLINTIEAMQENWISWAIVRLDWEAGAIQKCWYKANGYCFRWNVRRNAKRVFTEHGSLVRGAAKQGQFLEYDPNQGWEPLCEFLGKPIPQEEFPRGNVAQEFHNRIEGAMKPKIYRGARNLGLVMVSVAAASGYAFIEYRHVFEQLWQTVPSLLHL